MRQAPVPGVPIVKPVDPWLARRGADLREVFDGEQPARRLVSVCPYCPDAFERTASARAHGFDVTSQTCAVHVAALQAHVDAVKGAA